MKDIKIKKASLFILGAAIAFSVMAFCVKKVALVVNNNTIIFFRFSVSFIYIVFVILIRNLRGEKISLKTKHIGIHMLRSVTSLFAMLLFYYSLKYINLVDGTVLMMTGPLFVPILGFIIFGYKTDYKHWIAVVIGFLGVLLVLKPGYSLFNIKSLYALLGGSFSALALLIMREQTKKDSVHLCLFYYFLIATIASGIITIFEYSPPDFTSLMYLCGISISGIFYQEFLIRGAEIAPAKVVSSMMYTSIVFSYLFSLFFFWEIPDTITTIGVCIVVLGGILTVQFANKKYS